MGAAREYGEQSKAKGRAIGSVTDIVHAGEMIGRALAAVGDLPAARLLFVESLTFLRTIGTQICVAHNLECFARLAQAQGNSQKSARVLAASDNLLKTLNIEMLPIERALFEQTEAEARAARGDQTFAEDWRAGSAMTMEQAIDYVLYDE